VITASRYLSLAKFEAHSIKMLLAGLAEVGTKVIIMYYSYHSLRKAI
jgi:hypothetical protein